MIIVEVNGHEIEFPDGMSKEEIAAALNKQRSGGDVDVLHALDLSPLRDDLAKVAELIQEINGKITGAREDRFPELKTELEAIREAMPEMPEDRAPQLLTALSELKDAMTVTVEAPIVNVPESIINVDAPIVNVDAPDIESINTAISEINIPSLDVVEQILRGIKMSVDVKPENKPLITGYRVTSRGSDGEADVVEFIYEGSR